MADIYEQAAVFRKRLLKFDRQTAAQLVRSYGSAYRRIQLDLDSVRDRLEAARDAGVPQTQWQYLITRENRLQVLQTRVLEEITKFGGQAQVIIGGAIGEAGALGSRSALKLMDAALPPSVSVAPSTLPGQEPTALIPDEVRLATGAIERVTAATQPAGAITQLLAGLGPDAAVAVSDALVQGIATGSNPRQIAKQMQNALGGNLTRALTIARTETLRAYREASRGEYVANSDVLNGWIWIADLSPRTCASCWAQHGSEHPLDEPMATHPNCRCTMAPLTKSWDELGFDKATPESVRIAPGRSEFRKLPAAQQRAVLGERKYAAWKEGRIELADLVAERESPIWGRSSGEATLSAALRNAEARAGADAAAG
jgi:SPP1 gp7 family putative phage head morphogenesis protein